MVKKILRELRSRLRIRKIARSAILADFDACACGKNQGKHNLSFFLLIKDSAKYLNEWLAYHYSIGVEHFYIINDMSVDNIKQVLEPWKKLGIVSVADFKVDAMQNEMYTYFSRKLAGRTKWLGFLDLDEFLVVKSKKMIDWLNSFPENTSAVEINWCCFGSSGLENYEDVFVTKRFKKYANADFEANMHVKSIVKLGENFTFLNPHSSMPSAKYVRNSNQEIVKPEEQDFFQRQPVFDNAWINHYFCLSKEEFAEKIKRGKADSRTSIRNWEEFEYHNRNECTGDKSLETAEKQINDTLLELRL
ncbi:MAG: glycosyltransferase family 2 protein [Fibromonadaceae bacterium]|jgi:hypothetical protein|nr:glycosyltransferase family 2 protein [Fibromonadaceae bacterium]